MYFLKSEKRIQIALFVHIVTPILEHNESVSPLVKPYLNHVGDDISILKNVHSQTLSSISKQLLLILANDVETNPGPNNRDKLCIMHSNVQSLKNKVSLLEAESNDFDIITLSETWLTNLISTDSISIPNFHPPTRLDRPNDPHGGVAIYVRNYLYCKHRPDLHVDGLEAVWVETKLNQKSILIGSFYRPPNSLIHYWDLIGESFRKVNNTALPFLVLGDFNTDFLNNPSVHLRNIIQLNSLHQLTSEPTRITATSSTCLDLIITQTPELIESTEVLPAAFSDHSIPCLYLKNTTKPTTSFKRTILNYDKLNKEEYNRLLQLVEWDNIINMGTIDMATEEFIDRLMTSAMQCMPTKVITVRPNDVPWMTDGIRLLIKQRKIIHARAKLTDDPQDWHNFRQFRNYVTDTERERIAEYYKEIDKKASDPQNFGRKDWWKLVRSFFNKKGLSDEIPPLKLNANTYYSNKDKANILNNFFVEQSTLENDDDPVPQIPYANFQINDIILNEDEVESVVKGLDATKASGPDLVHNKLLIHAISVLACPLTKLFNRCLNEGKFPSLWKLAHVTPIYKKGLRELCTNYRPISLLSCVGKVLERCVHKHVYTFFKTHNVLTPHQSGFIPGDSAVNQLLSTYNNLCCSFDSGIITQTIYFDISKAFDRVWHKGLLVKLEAVGIRGKLHKFFHDYLDNRHQLVVVRGEKSDIKKIPAGVPQGSVLGPLLFVLYINDIVTDIESRIKLFADDTSLSHASNDPLREAILNADLERIALWSQTWKITFNATKTDLLNSTNHHIQTTPLTFGNHTLDPSESHKHLGVILQNNCRWDEHVQFIANKVNMLIACLRNYKYRLSRKSLETMYKSFIIPHFDYADIVWDNCTDTQSNVLEKLHLEAIRIIIGSVKGTSHEKLYEESGFSSLKERRKRHKLIQFYKMINQICPNYLTDLLPLLMLEQNPYHRRRPLERLVPRTRTELYNNSFLPSTTRLWNNLPDDIKAIDSISRFKRFLSLCDSTVPPYYYIGSRQDQVNHCRLRLGMSNINYDLYSRHLIDDPKCACGYPREDAEHYLLYCTKFHQERTNTILTLNVNARNAQTLLFGDRNLTTIENTDIFKTVQEFINASNRL